MENPVCFIAARAPKGAVGFNRTCSKCKVLLRASFTPAKGVPSPDSKTFCVPCYEAAHGAMKGARQ